MKVTKPANSRPPVFNLFIKMRIRRRNLRLADQRRFLIRQLPRGNNPPVPALQPVVFIRADQHQPVMPILTNTLSRGLDIFH